MADQQRASVSRMRVAIRSAVAFGAIVLTMSIWWPAGIAVALLVCGAATVLANRMLQTPVDGAVEGDLAALLLPFASDEALHV